MVAVDVKTRVSWPVRSHVSIKGIEARNSFDLESEARQAEKLETMEKIAFYKCSINLTATVNFPRWKYDTWLTTNVISLKFLS